MGKGVRETMVRVRDGVPSKGARGHSSWTSWHGLKNPTWHARDVFSSLEPVGRLDGEMESEYVHLAVSDLFGAQVLIFSQGRAVDSESLAGWWGNKAFWQPKPAAKLECLGRNWRMTCDYFYAAEKLLANLSTAGPNNP